MADDRLRISAEVTDGFTGPLAKMQTALRGVQTSGSASAGALKKDFEGAHGAIGKTTGALQQMTPVLTTFGLSTAGAALSLTGVASALKNFTGNTQALALMSRETGFTIDKLRAFGALGERFGVATSTMQGGLQKFSTEMDSVRRRYGETYGKLIEMNLGDLAEKLVNAPNMEAAMNTIMDRLAKIDNPVRRRKLAELFFGVGEIGSIAAELGSKFEQSMAENERRLGRTTQKQVEAAKRFEGSLAELRQNLDGLRTEALGPLVDKLNEVVNVLNTAEARSAFKDLLDEINKTAKTTVQEFNAIVAAWQKIKGFFGGDASQNREFTPGLSGGTLGSKAPLNASKLQGREASIRQQLELLDRNPGAADYQRKRDRMTEELKRVGDELQKLRENGTPTVQPQSFQGGGLGGLIQKASLGSEPILLGSRGALRRGGDGALSGDAGYSGVPGISRPSVPAITGGGALPPRGSGSLFGALPGAGSTGAGAANPSEAIRLGDAIARAEGTYKGGYDTVLGYGQYGRPNKPLSTMTLDEVHAFGLQMRQAQAARGTPWNRTSSASGRYQIVGSTMRNAQRELGLSGDTIFDGETQDRMMRWIARRQGLGAWEGFKLHPGERATAAQAMGAGGARDGAVASGMSRLRDSDIETPGSGERMGDAAMRRLYGDQAPVARAPVQQHRMSIDLNGFPAGARARAQMGDLFNEVSVAKGRQADAESI